MNIAANSIMMTSEGALMPPLARLKPMLRSFCAFHKFRSPKLRKSPFSNIKNSQGETHLPHAQRSFASHFDRALARLAARWKGKDFATALPWGIGFVFSADLSFFEQRWQSSGSAQVPFV